MIKIKNISRATIESSKTISKSEEKQIAGDIQNWLLTQKGIICDVEAQNEE